MLPGIISCTSNCLFSSQPPVIWGLRVEGWPELKEDGKCCLKWIRKAAGFSFTHSVTCAAKRKQVTQECVLKPKRNIRAQMICCCLGRSAFCNTLYILDWFLHDKCKSFMSHLNSCRWFMVLVALHKNGIQMMHTHGEWSLFECCLL